MLERFSFVLSFTLLTVGAAAAQDFSIPACNPSDYPHETALASDVDSAFRMLISLGATPNAARRQLTSVLVTSGCSPDMLSVDPYHPIEICEAARSLNMHPRCGDLVAEAETTILNPMAEEQFCLERIRAGGSEIASGGAMTARGRANASLDRAQKALDRAETQSGAERQASIDQAEREIDNAVQNNPALLDALQDTHSDVTEPQARVDLLKELNNPDESGLPEDEQLKICMQSGEFTLEQNLYHTLARSCLSGVPFDLEPVQGSEPLPIARRCNTERAVKSIAWLATELSDPNSLIGQTYIAGLQDAERRRAFARTSAQVPNCFGEGQPVWNDEILPNGGYECVVPDTAERDAVIESILANTLFEGCPPEQLYDCVRDRSERIDRPELVADPVDIAAMFTRRIAEREAKLRSYCLLFGTFDPGLGQFIRDGTQC